MFIGIMLFFVVIAMTLFFGKKGAGPEDVPVSETLSAPTPKRWELSLDRLGLWVIVAVVLILIAYGPFFMSYAPQFVSPGYRFF
jgi:cytochrome c oxidase subunit I